MPPKVILFLCLISLSTQHLSAQTYTWELERKETQNMEDHLLDSLALVHKQYLFRSQAYLKAEFPLQVAIGYEHIIPNGMAFHGSVGLSPKAFSQFLVNLASEDVLDPELSDFLEKRLRNGSVIEFGSGYYHLKSGFFASLGLQFHRYSISSTMDELVETMDLGMQAEEIDIEELLDNSQALSDFYYQETLYPTFRNTNLALSAGKLFRFRAIPQLSLSTMISYSLRLDNNISIEANSPIGRGLTVNLVNPLLSENMPENGPVGFPTLSLRVNYLFGEIIR